MAFLDEFYLRDIAHKGDLLRSPSGDLQTLSGVNNVREALFRRLVTIPGSLVHRPNYGVGIQEFKNAPATFDNQRRLAKRIKNQFELDFRVKEVIGIQIDLRPETPELTKIIPRILLEGVDEDVSLTFKPFEEASP